jgi:hypothetical protein
MSSLDPLNQCRARKELSLAIQLLQDGTTRELVPHQHAARARNGCNIHGSRSSAHPCASACLHVYVVTITCEHAIIGPFTRKWVDVPVARHPLTEGIRHGRTSE